MVVSSPRTNQIRTWNGGVKVLFGDTGLVNFLDK